MIFKRISFLMLALISVNAKYSNAMQQIKRFPHVIFNNYPDDTIITIYAQGPVNIAPRVAPAVIGNGQFTAKIATLDGTVLRMFSLEELYNIDKVTVTKDKTTGKHNIEVVPSAVQVKIVRTQPALKPVKIVFNNLTSDASIIVNSGIHLGPQSMNTNIDNVVHVLIKKPNGEIIKTFQLPELTNVKTINIVPGDAGSYSVEALP